MKFQFNPSVWLQKLRNLLAHPKAELVNTNDSEMLSMPPAAKEDRAFRLTGVLTTTIVLFVILFAIVLLFRTLVLFGVGDHALKNRPLIYQQGDSLRFTSQLVENPVVITNDLQWGKGDSIEDCTRLSENGKNLLYLNYTDVGSGELFLRNVNSEKARNKENNSYGVFVADRVKKGNFDFYDNSSAVVAVTTRGELLRWKNGSSMTLDSDCSTLLGVNENTVYYLKPTALGSGTFSLYSINPKEKEPKPTIIDTDIVNIIEKENVNRIIYSKYSADPKNPWNISWWDGKSIQILCENVGKLLEIGNRNEVYFTRNVDFEIDPLIYFSDNTYASDSLITEPDKNDFMIEKKNLWGRVTKVLDQEAYEAALSAYNDQLLRDEIREVLDTAKPTEPRITLHHRVGNSETQQSGEINAVLDVDPNSGRAVYAIQNIVIPERIDISTLESADQFTELLNQIITEPVNRQETVTYVELGHAGSTLSTDPVGTVKSAKLTHDRGGFYYTKSGNENQPDAFNFAQVLEGEVGVKKKVDEDVALVTDIAYKDGVLYLRNYGNSYQLCVAEGAKKTLLSQDATIHMPLEAHETRLLFYSDYSTTRQSGTFVTYRDSPKELLEDVRKHVFRTSNYIYLLSDYDRELGGDLYLYTGGRQPQKIAEHVLAIL